MGTDSVKLFNKRISDRILTMNKQKLVVFVEENLDVLKLKERTGGFVHSLIFFELQKHGGTVAHVVEDLIAKNNPLTELKIELIEDLAFGEERLYLDYWGCWAEVFDQENPKGSISSMDYLGMEEELYLFLKPSHVEKMIQSLKKHSSDLRVMDKAGIERLEYFRNFCLSHSEYRVAYIFDF